ncbi:MAG TPA: aldo/keto reductase [Bacteroidia bacterium]|jgi:voltage-dependent potassium channel beta subunit|nr:aldo/keto reductase [Bacteroidia bacterium]
MEYRRLGKSGLQVSLLSFGSWVTFGAQVGDDTAENCMKLAYDSGVNFFDNAEAYASGKSEVVMGNILKKMNWERSSYVVSTKVFWGGKKPNQSGLSRKHIFDACHNGLKRLQVDYLDLYFCHRPDPNTPIEETVHAMHDLVKQGKVLYWGTSEWSAEQLKEAYSIAKKNNLYAPTMEQPQYNLFERKRFEEEYAPLYKQEGMGTTIWSPTASGLLTGKYDNGIPTETRIHRPGMEWLKERMSDDKLKKARQFSAFARDLGTTPACLAIAWVVKNPFVSTAILGASRVSQLKENLNALEALPLLTKGVLQEIDDIFI